MNKTSLFDSHSHTKTYFYKVFFLYISAPGAHAGYNPDGTIAWDNQHMQMGHSKLPCMF